MFEDNEIDIELSFEPTCNPHPNAPHGFLRQASHSAGRYVCECEWWNEKDYELATLEEAEEFAEKRNYHYSNTDNPIDFPKCWCHTCNPITLDNMRMILCPTCGNKRCPKATDHRLECTNSNEPNQEGSYY